MQEFVLFSGQNYTVGTHFIRLPVVMVPTNLNSSFDKDECADVEIVHVDGSGGGLHVPPSKQDHCPVSHPLLPYRHPELRKFPISATSDESWENATTCVSPSVRQNMRGNVPLDIFTGWSGFAVLCGVVGLRQTCESVWRRRGGGGLGQRGQRGGRAEGLGPQPTAALVLQPDSRSALAAGKNCKM